MKLFQLLSGLLWGISSGITVGAMTFFDLTLNWVDIKIPPILVSQASQVSIVVGVVALFFVFSVACFSYDGRFKAYSSRLNGVHET